MPRLHFYIDVEDETTLYQDDDGNIEGVIWDSAGIEHVMTRDTRPSLAQRLDCLLFPEDYPEGHELHDPDHMYWVDYEEPQEGMMAEGFQWDSETIEWVAEAVKREVEIERGR